MNTGAIDLRGEERTNGFLTWPLLGTVSLPVSGQRSLVSLSQGYPRRPPSPWRSGVPCTGLQKAGWGVRWLWVQVPSWTRDCCTLSFLPYLLLKGGQLWALLSHSLGAAGAGDCTSSLGTLLHSVLSSRVKRFLG